MSDLNMPYEKMSDFVSLPLFGFTLVIKLRNFDFESHWDIWLEKRMPDLIMSCQTVSGLVYVLLFE